MAYDPVTKSLRERSLLEKQTLEAATRSAQTAAKATGSTNALQSRFDTEAKSTSQSQPAKPAATSKTSAVVPPKPIAAAQKSLESRLGAEVFPSTTTAPNSKTSIPLESRLDAVGTQHDEPAFRPQTPPPKLERKQTGDTPRAAATQAAVHVPQATSSVAASTDLESRLNGPVVHGTSVKVEQSKPAASSSSVDLKLSTAVATKTEPPKGSAVSAPASGHTSAGNAVQAPTSGVSSTPGPTRAVHVATPSQAGAASSRSAASVPVAVPVSSQRPATNAEAALVKSGTTPSVPTALRTAAIAVQTSSAVTDASKPKTPIDAYRLVRLEVPVMTPEMSRDVAAKTQSIRDLMLGNNDNNIHRIALQTGAWMEVNRKEGWLAVGGERSVLRDALLSIESSVRAKHPMWRPKIIHGGKTPVAAAGISAAPQGVQSMPLAMPTAVTASVMPLTNAHTPVPLALQSRRAGVTAEAVKPAPLASEKSTNSAAAPSRPQASLATTATPPKDADVAVIKPSKNSIKSAAIAALDAELSALQSNSPARELATKSTPISAGTPRAQLATGTTLVAPIGQAARPTMTKSVSTPAVPQSSAATKVAHPVTTAQIKAAQVPMPATGSTMAVYPTTPVLDKQFSRAEVNAIVAKAVASTKESLETAKAVDKAQPALAPKSGISTPVARMPSSDQTSASSKRNSGLGSPSAAPFAAWASSKTTLASGKASAPPSASARAPMATPASQSTATQSLHPKTAAPATTGTAAAVTQAQATRPAAQPGPMAVLQKPRAPITGAEPRDALKQAKTADARSQTDQLATATVAQRQILPAALAAASPVTPSKGAAEPQTNLKDSAKAVAVKEEGLSPTLAEIDRFLSKTVAESAQSSDDATWQPRSAEVRLKAMLQKRKPSAQQDSPSPQVSMQQDPPQADEQAHRDVQTAQVAHSAVSDDDMQIDNDESSGPSLIANDVAAALPNEVSTAVQQPMQQQIPEPRPHQEEQRAPQQPSHEAPQQVPQAVPREAREQLPTEVRQQVEQQRVGHQTKRQVEQQQQQAQVVPSSRVTSTAPPSRQGSTRVDLPQDPEAVQLFEAINNFRESRDMFPVGRQHIHRLYRLLSLPEGPFKTMMAETERLIANE